MSDARNARTIIYLLDIVIGERDNDGQLPQNWHEMLKQTQEIMRNLLGWYRMSDNGLFYVRYTIPNKEAVHWICSNYETLQVLLDYHMSTGQMPPDWIERVREVQEIMRHIINVAEGYYEQSRQGNADD